MGCLAWLFLTSFRHVYGFNLSEEAIQNYPSFLTAKAFCLGGGGSFAAQLEPSSLAQYRPLHAQNKNVTTLCPGANSEQICKGKLQRALPA
jgi:hypothetical protein